MMDFELKLEKPNVSRAWISAATMGISYFIGKWDRKECRDDVVDANRCVVR